MSGPEDTAETKPEVKKEGVMSIKIKDQQGGEVVFQVKGHTKFQKIFEAFASKKAVDLNQIRFLFDGARVDPHMTPNELEMEDGDNIDVVISQIGGGY